MRNLSMAVVDVYDRWLQLLSTYDVDCLKAPIIQSLRNMQIDLGWMRYAYIFQLIIDRLICYRDYSVNKEGFLVTCFLFYYLIILSELQHVFTKYYVNLKCDL